MKTSFDRVAPFYDALSYLAFKGNIQRAQRYFLPAIRKDTHLLFIGGGTGFLLPDLFRLQRVTHITYIEASARMLAKAKAIVVRYQKKHPTSALPTFTFIHGTEQHIPRAEKYQVVITNFVLDMYPDEAIPAFMRRIVSHLSSDAIWLFTDFRLSNQESKRGWQRPLLRLMFWFFRLAAGLTTQLLPHYSRHFENAGWKKSQEQSFFGDFIVSRVYKAATTAKKDDSLLDRQ